MSCTRSFPQRLRREGGGGVERTEKQRRWCGGGRFESRAPSQLRRALQAARTRRTCYRVGAARQAAGDAGHGRGCVVAGRAEPAVGGRRGARDVVRARGARRGRARTCTRGRPRPRRARSAAARGRRQGARAARHGGQAGRAGIRAHRRRLRARGAGDVVATVGRGAVRARGAHLTVRCGRRESVADAPHPARHGRARRHGRRADSIRPRAGGARGARGAWQRHETHGI